MRSKENKLKKTKNYGNTEQELAQSSNPMDQFSDLVYNSVDNIVDTDNEETKQQ